MIEKLGDGKLFKYISAYKRKTHHTYKRQRDAFPFKVVYSLCASPHMLLILFLTQLQSPFQPTPPFVYTEEFKCWEIVQNFHILAFHAIEGIISGESVLVT